MARERFSRGALSLLFKLSDSSTSSKSNAHRTMSLHAYPVLLNRIQHILNRTLKLPADRLSKMERDEFIYVLDTLHALRVSPECSRAVLHDVSDVIHNTLIGHLFSLYSDVVRLIGIEHASIYVQRLLELIGSSLNIWNKI